MPDECANCKILREQLAASDSLITDYSQTVQRLREQLAKTEGVYQEVCLQLKGAFTELRMSADEIEAKDKEFATLWAYIQRVINSDLTIWSERIKQEGRAILTTRLLEVGLDMSTAKEGQ